ncbi:MAG: outer membrane beta-barrel protein [bacterium]
MPEPKNEINQVCQGIREVKMRLKLLSILMVMFFWSLSSVLIYAQGNSSASRFSHKGLKAALGSASFEMLKERGLRDGEGGMLSVGYGFSDRFSLWLTLVGSEHASFNSEQLDTDFGGVELNLQHKFEIESRFQPYGKLGFGVYALSEKTSELAFVGAGLNVALGADFFFSKHFGVGAELMYKKLDYYSEKIETPDGNLFRDLDPILNGDTVGFMLTFTIQ